MSLRDELEEVRRQHGRLTPEVVVDVARPKTHPLHDRFEWNNTVAGEAWRRQQAHDLIRSVRVTYRQPTEHSSGDSVRAYHAIPSDDGWHYEPAEDVAADPILSAIVLAEMEREWKALHRRYGHFAEFAALVVASIQAAA